ncbi:hypothetical protein [Rhodococcus sp. USK13]|uniref:hypothetical protein n=1 Tax=Rhodococcus sp. USK13 TaxID=2806442 RepID=UPI001BD03873|nr:hypothetical protein [Rhodococcus sp. USK13]
MVELQLDANADLAGAPTSHTALLLEPYLPEERSDDWCGQSTMSQTDLTEWLLEVSGRTSNPGRAFGLSL